MKNPMFARRLPPPRGALKIVSVDKDFERDTYTVEAHQPSYLTLPRNFVVGGVVEVNAEPHIVLTVSFNQVELGNTIIRLETVPVAQALQAGQKAAAPAASPAKPQPVLVLPKPATPARKLTL